MPRQSARAEITSSNDEHFEFGKNWSRFLSTLDDERVDIAKKSLQKLLQTDNLQRRRFLDAGSGSGLFSLVANQLGADVTSFDVDPNSVACTRSLKQRFVPDAKNWTILEGSLTDRHFLTTIGEFDVVYCWGVAHHTGQLWNCLENLLPTVKSGGLIVLAVYNDQLHISKRWYEVKRIYQQLPQFIRPAYVAAIGSLSVFKRLILTMLSCCLRLLRLKNPFVPIWQLAHDVAESRGMRARGMHEWYDLVDWVGGWPFEVAKPEDVFRFMRDRGFSLQELTTSSGHGCNEFVFIRTDRNPSGL